MRVLHALLLSLLATSKLASRTPSQIAVTHITVIDVRDGSLNADMTVLILGNRISTIGPSKVTRLPNQAHVVAKNNHYYISSFDCFCWPYSWHYGPFSQSPRNQIS